MLILLALTEDIFDKSWMGELGEVASVLWLVYEAFCHLEIDKTLQCPFYL